MGGWVSTLGGAGQITKNHINIDLINIIQFCLKMICGDAPTYGLVYGWMGGLMDGSVVGVMSNNQKLKNLT